MFGEKNEYEKISNQISYGERFDLRFGIKNTSFASGCSAGSRTENRTVSLLQ